MFAVHLLMAETASPSDGIPTFLLALSGTALLIVLGAVALTFGPRRIGFHWSITLLTLPLPLIAFAINPVVGWGALLMIGAGTVGAANFHHRDIASGGDIAQNACQRRGLREAMREGRVRRFARDVGWIFEDQMIVGERDRELPVWIPIGRGEGRHTLIPGATGSGKSVTAAWIAGRMIEVGHGCVAIDPKGDQLLRKELMRVASRRRGRFLEWSLDGPCIYNPYASGSYSEIAEKALAGEQFTEPHYLRQAQRYLAHAVASMRAAGIEVTPVTLMEHMNPAALEASSRRLPEEDAARVQAYLDSLTERQKRELAGVRDRLSILAESQARRWLHPHELRRGVAGPWIIGLQDSICDRDVVYFRLEADRMPLLSQMIAAAVITDLVTISAQMQKVPIPTVILIDEFSAIAGEQVARLFSRGRSAGLSLILATQELADLRAAGDGELHDQVLGNLDVLIAHRQNVPESAETISSIAGTTPVWITTQQTMTTVFPSIDTGQGSRTRGHEYNIHPTTIKQLATGQAAVITPGRSQKPTIARINHPGHAVLEPREIW